MKSALSIIFILISASMILKAGVNEPYKKVDHVIWVVNQLETVVDSWEKLGFTDFKHLEKAELRTDEKFIEVKAMAANLAGSKVIWIQPVRGRSFLTDVLEKNGPGIYALIHPVKSKSMIKHETERLQKRRVDVEIQFTLKSDDYQVEYTVMQTEKDGTYDIGFAHHSEAEKIFQNLDGSNTNNLRFSQYAFTTNEPKEVSRYWSHIGLPKMEITHGSVHDKTYYGKPSDFDMKLGWQKHGDVTYEWCIPLKSPNVYEDHINQKGQGVHHFGFNVANMEQVLNHFKEKGFVISQSGGWGEKGKPGSGKFAYIDPKPLGGIAVELLWSYDN
jgi:hypothetical protein